MHSPGCTTLRRKCCSSKAVPCPYPNPNSEEVWSTSIFRGLHVSFHGINLRIMQTELKMVLLFSTKFLSMNYNALNPRTGSLEPINDYTNTVYFKILSNETYEFG